MEVQFSDGAREFAQALGGVVFVYPHSHRCCHGSITLLDTSTLPTRTAQAVTSVKAAGIDVHFCGESTSQPDQLVIELRGVVRKRLVSFWDGCAIRP
jgi:hypothetical protein